MDELQTLIVSRKFTRLWEDARTQLREAIERRDKARRGSDKWHAADADVQKWGDNFRLLEKIYDGAGGPRA